VTESKRNLRGEAFLGGKKAGCSGFSGKAHLPNPSLHLRGLGVFPRGEVLFQKGEQEEGGRRFMGSYA